MTSQIKSAKKGQEKAKKGWKIAISLTLPGSTSLQKHICEIKHFCNNGVGILLALSKPKKGAKLEFSCDTFSIYPYICQIQIVSKFPLMEFSFYFFKQD